MTRGKGWTQETSDLLSKERQPISFAPPPTIINNQDRGSPPKLNLTLGRSIEDVTRSMDSLEELALDQLRLEAALQPTRKIEMKRGMSGRDVRRSIANSEASMYSCDEV